MIVNDLIPVSTIVMQPSEVEKLIQSHALSIGLDPKFALRVAYLESRFDPLAESPTGALGVFQITSAALKHYNSVNMTSLTKADLLDPQHNVRVGCWYLKWIAAYLGIQSSKISGPNAARVYAGFNVGVGTLGMIERGEYHKAAKVVSVQSQRLSQGGPQHYLANVMSLFG